MDGDSALFVALIGGGAMLVRKLIAAGTLWLGYAYFLRSKGRFADEV